MGLDRVISFSDPSAVEQCGVELVEWKQAYKLITDCQAHSFYFNSFSQSQLATACEESVAIKARKNLLVIKQGDEASFVGLILRGSMNVVQKGAIVYVIKEGDFVGDLGLFQGGLRTADVVSAEDDTVFVAFPMHLDIHPTASIENPETWLKLLKMWAKSSFTKLVMPSVGRPSLTLHRWEISGPAHPSPLGDIWPCPPFTAGRYLALPTLHRWEISGPAHPSVLQSSSTPFHELLHFSLLPKNS
ncbi:hypothetical protein CYMTET_38991 [Cymbomonas tetramitiformis]|uniref:Cyclic nucleotide-binding domain-containing protein n=1 Tax=Cymbomonas tetramitiformis TaxID=36881 RepID=A0AAE0F4D6_9CHLO|nr:hypothetical protein CYMTET_38991 [Cymbomonas tetramitiformis]